MSGWLGGLWRIITIAAVVAGTAVGVTAAATSRPVAGAEGPATASCAVGTTVSTASGPVCGLQAGTSRQWLGIPYAAAPVGPLRWASPEPHGVWTGVLPAVQYGPSCPSLGQDAATATEDCLHLNVAAPQNAGRPLPVMVWIHGGGFGGGSSSQFPGVDLAQSGHVVFVAMDYRLGLLGFLASSAFGRHAGDYGLQDQQAALQWVKRNIRAFGGDPSNVTIFGQSAGGSSVCDQLASPTATHLFSKAISQSGFYNSVTGANTYFQPQDCKAALPTETQAAAAGATFAQGVGCTNPATTAACLRALPLSTLLAPTAATFAATNSPIINGSTLTMSPQRAFATGHFNRVPIIMGTLRDENLIGLPTTAAEVQAAVKSQYGTQSGKVLTAYPLDRYASPYVAFRTIVADSDVVCPSLRAEQQISGRTRVYAYEIDDPDAPPLSASYPTPGMPNGAFHSADLALLFPDSSPVTVGTPLPALDANQQVLSDQVIAEWTTFARTGNPTATGTPLWPNSNSRVVMTLQPSGDSHLATVGQTSALHRCGLWNALSHT